MKLTAIDLIAMERDRQIVHEGWTPEHDDDHRDGALRQAAIFYLNMCMGFGPWPGLYEKRAKKTEIQRLVIAGALIAAEIERLQRAQEKPRGLVSEGSAS